MVQPIQSVDSIEAEAMSSLLHSSGTAHQALLQASAGSPVATDGPTGAAAPLSGQAAGLSPLQAVLGLLLGGQVSDRCARHYLQPV